MSTIAIHPTYRPTRPAAAPTAGSLRLTRRGRAVVLLAGLLALLVAAVILGSGSVATQEKGADTVLTEIHTVSGGETLWEIADRIDDTGSTAAMVDRIEEMNGLESANLAVGQELRVPVAE